MESQGNIIDSKENVARLLSNEWLVEGEVSVDAFALAPKETYLSVNRPSVPTYEADVRKFVSSHREYLFAENNEMVFSAAMMNVGDIRGIIVDVDGSSMDLVMPIRSLMLVSLCVHMVRILSGVVLLCLLQFPKEFHPTIFSWRCSGV